VVHDRRPSLEAADYSFGEREADTTDLDVDDVQEFLDEMVGSRLMYEEGGRYLAEPAGRRLSRALTPS
jgi:hypothetical protein